LRAAARATGSASPTAGDMRGAQPGRTGAGSAATATARIARSLPRLREPFFRARGQPLVVGGDPEHHRPGDRIGHLLRQRARLLGADAPVPGVIEVRAVNRNQRPALNGRLYSKAGGIRSASRPTRRKIRGLKRQPCYVRASQYDDRSDRHECRNSDKNEQLRHAPNVAAIRERFDLPSRGICLIIVNISESQWRAACVDYAFGPPKLRFCRDPALSISPPPAPPPGR
jgi:hypothetical protein